MDYLIDSGVLASLPEAFGANNPATPFPDCVSLKVVSRTYEDTKSSEVLAHLRFGTQILTAHLGEKRFSFSVGLSKAKLRLLAVEGLKINDLSVKGAGEVRNPMKFISRLEQEHSVSKEGMMKIKSAISGIQSLTDIIQTLASLELGKIERNNLASNIEWSHEFKQIETSFDDRGPVWHILPQFDVRETFKRSEISRHRVIDGPVLHFGDGPLFRYSEVNSYTNSHKDSCLIFAISARIRDVNIDILDDEDNVWWQDMLRRRGFREKREVARVALRNIIARRISRDSPEHLDGDLLFVVAAAEPIIEE